MRVKLTKIEHHVTETHEVGQLSSTYTWISQDSVLRHLVAESVTIFRMSCILSGQTNENNHTNFCLYTEQREWQFVSNTEIILEQIHQNQLKTIKFLIRGIPAFFLAFQ